MSWGSQEIFSLHSKRAAFVLCFFFTLLKRWVTLQIMQRDFPSGMMMELAIKVGRETFSKTLVITIENLSFWCCLLKRTLLQIKEAVVSALKGLHSCN